MPGFRHMPIGSAIGTGSYIFRHYGEEQTAYPDYLCFTAEEAGSTLEMVAARSAPSVSLEYSTDRENWSEFVVDSTVVTFANIGDKVYLRGNNTRFGSDERNYNAFLMTGKIAASGNLMSIFDKTCQQTSLSSDYAAACMFLACYGLTAAPKLPATTVSTCCYLRMFEECFSLEEIEISATSMTGCTRMFFECNKLRYIKVHITEWKSLFMWVSGVASSGTFVCPSTLDTSIRDVDHIPSGWAIETY